MNELVIDGKTYISSKRAAEITGYAKDYVGQLCREGRIEARLVGRNWYVLESSVREHRFGKEEKGSSAGEVKGGAKSTYTWGEPKYEPEIPTTIPTLSEREELDLLKNSAEEEGKVTVLTDMQAAWQEWFTKKGQESSFRAEIPTDIQEETESIDVSVKVIREDVAVESPALDGKEEYVNEEGGTDEVPVTLHVSKNEPQEVLDLSNAAIDESEVDEEIVIKETPVRMGNYILLRSVFVAVMLVAVAITAVGTGYVTKYDSYGISRISEIKYLAGVSEYNK